MPVQHTLSLDIAPLQRPITYDDRILLIGSCFTEHMASRLSHHLFQTLSNPHGILFNPLSVAHSLDAYLQGRQYEADELFYLNELWNSWDHHSLFSHPSQAEALRLINQSQQQASAFIRQAGWLVITLGSAFQYYLKEGGRPVANNHRAPAQWFEKRLLDTGLITDTLAATLGRLKAANPGLQVLLTISPVRHIRDGVVANNRSKARLIEAVHSLCDRLPDVHYFPAYELLIDILRDHRFYDIDMVHPNYQATTYVWERFSESCITPAARPLMQEIAALMTARAHRPRFPQTSAHRQFRESCAARVRNLAARHPGLDLAVLQDFFEA